MDDDELLSCIKNLIENKIKILDVLTPFPVHGLDQLMGLKRSRIPIVGFISGAIGCVFALGFQIWIFTRAFPMDIGGKPFLSIPSLVPVTFEISVLAAAFGMVGAFFYNSNLRPRSKNKIHDERITDDRFVILLDLEKESTKSDEEKINQVLNVNSALGVTTKEV